jgi:hypothetical protein
MTLTVDSPANEFENSHHRNLKRQDRTAINSNIGEIFFNEPINN